MTKIISEIEPKCKGDLVHSKCQGHCISRCVDGEIKVEGSCLLDICIPGCKCPPELYQDGLKCLKKQDCLSIPKGNMLKGNEV